MNSRNLALEALRQLDRSLEFADWENGDGEEIGAQLREAVAALLAETGEPVDCQFQGPDGRWHSFVNEQHKENTIASGKWPIRNLYASPPTEGPYAWTVDASTRMWFGDYAEDDAGAEAAHCGGTCKAFPLYKGAPA